MPPRSSVHFKMKKQELLSSTHSILNHRLFWNCAVEKNFIPFSDYSSLWLLILYPSRNTNQEQKISSASDSKIQKLLTEKIKTEARPQAKPALGTAAGTTPTTRLAHHKRNSNRNGKRFQIQTPKT
ncbi:hypothetical protein AVEN_20485-1 [Araneus ventricosus]|uniref:Uncharacterized protein n=1 Tax=Araneus ventricosus TaxID=182803 RepID=A0A4Y2SYQ0_ARAVE|nr:hypothetical protein AVEN_234703-1 [Araneus ventricosus]GBN92015.1 hypothetical protein AVEN_20485-1 [Araneus ventricosus]